MRVFKYRGLQFLERDIACMVADNLFAPTAAQLNDPTEVLFNDIAIARFANSASRDVAVAFRALTEMRHTIGIYSLSRVATDELMWAHYADSHAGYCIEYDLDRLTLEHRDQWTRLDVKYSGAPPEIDFGDIFAQSDPRRLAQKMFGNKSLRWSYESEFRIITTTSGLNNYARASLIGLHFGHRCTDATIDRIRSALANRRINYFRIEPMELSYSFHSMPIKRSEIDGAGIDHSAPIEEGAILSEGDLGADAHLRPKLIEAAERTRRDPSCASVKLVDFSGPGPKRSMVYVQFESTVKTPLYPVVNMYFNLEDL